MMLTPSRPCTSPPRPASGLHMTCCRVPLIALAAGSTGSGSPWPTNDLKLLETRKTAAAAAGTAASALRAAARHVSGACRSSAVDGPCAGCAEARAAVAAAPGRGMCVWLAGDGGAVGGSAGGVRKTSAAAHWGALRPPCRRRLGGPDPPPSRQLRRARPAVWRAARLHLTSDGLESGSCWWANALRPSGTRAWVVGAAQDTRTCYGARRRTVPKRKGGVQTSNGR